MMPSKKRSSPETLARLHADYAQACARLERLAQLTQSYRQWEGFGAKLSALYLRLKQGPVRAVIMGQTSSGKSTLINAFAGDFIAPESAGACTLIPIWLMNHQSNATQINKYHRQQDRLPTFEIVGPGELIAQHHDIRSSNAPDDGSLPYVLVSSGSFPRSVTLIDSPGLNASREDTDRLHQLFEVPVYATDTEKDLPEIILYVTSMANNLSDSEKNDLRRLMDCGIDPQHILIVKNEFRQAYDLQLSSYEAVDPTAVQGLAKSLYSLLLPEAPESFGSMGFGSFDAWDTLPQPVMSEAEAAEHVFCVNALIARLHYVQRDNGVYDPTHFPPKGCTQEIFDKLLEAKRDERQLQMLRVRDARKASGHSEYQPMRQLIDAIEAHAATLADRDTHRLQEALRALDRLQNEILHAILHEMDQQVDPLCQALDGHHESIQRLRASVTTCSSLPALKEAVSQCDDTLRATWDQTLTLHGRMLSYIVDQFTPSEKDDDAPQARSLTSRLSSALFSRMIPATTQEKCRRLWLAFKWKEADMYAAYCAPSKNPAFFIYLNRSVFPLVQHINKTLFDVSLLDIHTVETAASALDEKLAAAMHDMKLFQSLLRAWLLAFRHTVEEWPHDGEAFAREASACLDSLSLPDKLRLSPHLMQDCVQLDHTVLQMLDIEKLPAAQNVLEGAFISLHHHGPVEQSTIKSMTFDHVICYFLRQLATNARVAPDAAMNVFNDTVLAKEHEFLKNAFSPPLAALQEAFHLSEAAVAAAAACHRRRLEERKAAVRQAFEQIDHP